MDKDNGGGNSPPVREVGDAPHITRLLNQSEESKKLFLSSWSSPEKFARRLLDINPTEEEVWYDDHVWKDANKRFSGVDSIEEAVDLAYNGWKEGGEIIERTRGYIQALNPLSPKLVKYGIAGSTPNVPRAIAGNLLNMRVPDPKAGQKRKTITIIYNMCEHGGNDKQAITNKAAVMAALVDEIEAKGFSVEVISTCVTSNTRIRCVTSVLSKESHIPVDINRLAFSLGHSAMFRVLFFADWECDHFCKDLGYGLGQVNSTTSSKEQNENNIFTVTSAGSKFGFGARKNNLNLDDFETMEKAVTVGLNSIVRELQKQGCPAFPKLEKDHEDDLENEKPREEDEVPEDEDEDDDDFEW